MSYDWVIGENAKWYLLTHCTEIFKSEHFNHTYLYNKRYIGKTETFPLHLLVIRVQQENICENYYIEFYIICVDFDNVTRSLQKESTPTINFLRYEREQF